MKFANKLSLSILSVGIFCLGISSYAIYQINYDSLLESRMITTEAMAEKVSGDLHQFLKEKIKTALTLANAPIIKNALTESNLSYMKFAHGKRNEKISLLNERWKSIKDEKDPFIQTYTDNKVSRYLRNQQRTLEGEYGEIFLTNQYGALLATTSKLSTFAHGHKYWWLGAWHKGAGSVFLDDRGYDDSVGGHVLGLVVPVKSGDTIIGILKCNLNILAAIAESISGIPNYEVGAFKLVRSGGMIVFEEGVEPLSTRVKNAVSTRMKNGFEGTVIVKEGQEKYLVGLHPIEMTKGAKGYGFGGTFESIDHKKGNTGESWYLACYRPMNMILAPIRSSIKTVIYVGILLVLILALVARVLSQMIAKPLKSLDEATRKIGKGQFDYKIDCKRDDEFGNVAKSLNRMAGELQTTTTSIDTLKKEIHQRKQVEAELRKSRRLFKAAIENSPIAMVVSEGADEKTITLNKKFTEAFGYTLTDIPDISAWWPLAYPSESYRAEIRLKWAQVMEKVKSGESETQSVDASVTCKDGSKKEVTIQRGSLAETHFIIFIDLTERILAEKEREKLIDELKNALKEIKTLKGILPICSYCKKIRDDKGYWNQLESYIDKHSDAEFSHSICPECAKKHYPEYGIYDD